MITLSGCIFVPEAELGAVRRALPSHIEATLAESGCLVFEVREDPLSPGRFEVYEEFEDRAAFELHQSRVKASAWGNVCRNVKRNYQITETQ